MTKEKYAWTGFGIPLAWLAQLDDLAAPNALADAFGDRYLYRHHPIFATTRDAVIELGFRFSSEDTPLWRNYQAFSLVALHEILASKMIPYFDTGTAIGRLIQLNPAARLPPGFIASNVKRNYAFHESVHCLANSILHRREAGLRTAVRNEADRIVLEAVLAESFANAVEALGSVSRHMPVSDGVFYPLNSYFSLSGERENALNSAGAELGAELRFALLFFSYFEANLAMQPPDELAYQRIMEATECPADYAGCARKITDTSFQLNAGFRESTTPAYFELLGYAREYRALASANWISRAENRSFARNITRMFWESAGKV